jgi:hypothetical protein
VTVFAVSSPLVVNKIASVTREPVSVPEISPPLAIQFESSISITKELVAKSTVVKLLGSAGISPTAEAVFGSLRKFF